MKDSNIKSSFTKEAVHLKKGRFQHFRFFCALNLNTKKSVVV